MKFSKRCGRLADAHRKSFGSNGSTVAMHERAAAADHHVALVARVRLLRVQGARRVELHRQRAVLEHERRSLAFRAGDAGEKFGGMESLALHRRSVTVL